MSLLLLVATVALAASADAAQEIPRSGEWPPSVVKVVKAAYTPEARAARIEGTVLVDVVVLPDGTVGDEVTVVRSLDSKHGLDAEAVKASRQWLFKPATKHGKPIAAHVTIEQTFKLQSK